MEVNFFTTLRASRAVLKTMVDQGSGAIVNVASVNFNLQPDGSVIDYGTAKAAVINLTRALADEFGSQGIRVNAVSPGPVNTDLWLSEDGIAETIAAASGMDAARCSGFCSCSHGRSCHCRFTLPEEVAGLVTYLASPAARASRGSTISSTGDFSARIDRKLKSKDVTRSEAKEETERGSHCVADARSMQGTE